MPHYKDGKEAKLGDIVKGKLINTFGEVYGVVVQVTPSNKCNAIVAYKFGNRASFVLDPTKGDIHQLVETIHSDYADLDQLELVYRHDS